MKWAEITVMTRPGAAEAVSGLMIEEGSRGAAIASPSAMYEGEIRVVGYLPVDDMLEGRLLAMRDRIEGLKDIFDESVDTGSLDITVRRIEEADWAESWKTYYKPLSVGRVVIKPSWEEFEAQDDQVVVELDPGMAFGTGQHPTTQLCIKILPEIIKGGETVADIGTGSGILGIAAAKLGAKMVYAIDIDSVAVKVAKENVELNGLLDDKMRVWEADSITAIPESVDVVIANILPNVIMALAPEVPKVLKPGGVMISSGIIDLREYDVTEALEDEELETVKVERDGSWVAILSRKRA